jgi:ribosome-associated protein
MSEKIKTNSSILSQHIVEGILERKGLNVLVLDLRKVSNAVCDYFIICEGTSNTHVEAVAESAIDFVREKLHQKPFHKEGFGSSEWILIDYFDVIVHVFQKHTRDFYRLEDLWADAEFTQIKED